MKHSKLTSVRVPSTSQNRQNWQNARHHTHSSDSSHTDRSNLHDSLHRQRASQNSISRLCSWITFISRLIGDTRHWLTDESEWTDSVAIRTQFVGQSVRAIKVWAQSTTTQWNQLVCHVMRIEPRWMMTTQRWTYCHQLSLVVDRYIRDYEPA